MIINKEPVISIKNIDHYYGRGSLKKQILFDISLEVYAGEIVIMTGPSGSGKTTLLSLIGGLRSVQEGSLKFLGEELCGASQSKLVQMRRKIGYIFQAHNLLGFLTARQNVQMAVELNHHISQSTAISQSEGDVVEIMQRLAKDQGTAILLVTHDNRILDIADRIVEMEDGLLTRDAQNVPANRKS